MEKFNVWKMLPLVAIVFCVGCAGPMTNSSSGTGSNGTEAQTSGSDKATSGAGTGTGGTEAESSGTGNATSGAGTGTGGTETESTGK